MIEIKRLFKFGFGVLCVLCVSILLSFSQKEDADPITQKPNSIPPLVKQKLKEKLAKFKRTIIEKCKREAIEEAELYVDSLVAEELKLLGSDTISFPSKPVRPGLPQKIILNDSTNIDPIF